MNKNNFFQIPFEQKNIAETETGVKIKGLASTRNLDRYGDSVEPTAFSKTLEAFMKNPVMLLQHNQDKPIGRFLSAEVVNDWLEVVGEILYNEDDVVSKVKSGVMQAFSIGYIPTKWEIRNAEGVLMRTEEGFQNGFSYDSLWNQKTTRTIKELDLVEISVVSVPANAYSTFGLEASTKSFFDNLEKDWQEEMKNMENKTQWESLQEKEKQDSLLCLEWRTEEVEWWKSGEKPKETVENNDIPVIGDELRDTDNVANEVLKEIQENLETENVSDNSENSESENLLENLESEKSFEAEGKNLENLETQKITESSDYKELLQKSEKFKEIAKNLIEELEARDAEIRELKNILAKIPVRKGLANVGNNPAQQQPKQKSFLEKLIDEANQF